MAVEHAQAAGGGVIGLAGADSGVEVGLVLAGGVAAQAGGQAPLVHRHLVVQVQAGLGAFDALCHQ